MENKPFTEDTKETVLITVSLQDELKVQSSSTDINEVIALIERALKYMKGKKIIEKQSKE